MPDCSTLIPVKRLRRKADWKECYKCPHNGAVKGEFKKSPCANCPGPSEATNNHGQNHVSFDLVDGFIQSNSGPAHEGDEGHTPAALLQDPGTPGEPVQEAEETFAALPAEVCNALRTFFGEWMRMPTTMREAVAMRIAEPEIEYQVIAKKLGVTMQAVATSLNNATGSKCRALSCLILTKHKPRPIHGNLNTTAFRDLVIDIVREHCPIQKTALVRLVTKATGSESQSRKMVGRLVNEGHLTESSNYGPCQPRLISLPDTEPMPAA